MSDLTPQDVDLRLTATRNELVEEDVRLWEGLEDEKISRIAGDEANKLFAEQVQSENQGTEGRLSTEVIHRSEGDLNNITSLNALAQAMSDYRVKTDLELAREKIAREQLGVDLSSQIAIIEASFNHREYMLYAAIEDVQNDVDGKYASMDKRIQKYEELLQDITTDSIQITMDNGEINMGAWTILSQAREWDLEIIAGVKGYQDKTTEDINQALEDIQNKLPVEQDIIDKAIEALSEAPIIKELDEKLASNVEDIHNVQKDLLKEVQDRQDQMVGLAQEQANEMDKYNKELVTKIETESQARVDAIQREAEIRQAELVNEANERTAEIDEKLANIEIDLDVDLSALNKRVDDVNKKADDYKADADRKITELNTKADGIHSDLADETAARIDAIKKLDDGLTAEIQFRKDGDKATMTALDNYKVSNDKALANVRDELAINVTATSANATAIKALDVRLTTNEDETGQAKQLAASAVQKADTALTETSALATQMTAVNASIDGINTELANKADASAFNQLKSEVTTIDGKVTTNTSDLTALKGTVTSLDGKVTGNTSAISELKTEQVIQGNKITQLTSDTTALKNTIEDIQDDMSTKVEATAFNELKTEVTKQGQDITAISSDVTTLKSDVNTIKGEVATKAEASAVQALETKVSTIDGKVSVNSEAITKLTGRVETNEKNIAKKLDASVIDAYSTTVETNKAIAERITAYDANLVIGGSNLLKNTVFEGKGSVPDNWVFGVHNSLGSSASLKAVGSTIVYDIKNAPSTNDVSLKQTLPASVMERSLTFTMSAMIKSITPAASIRYRMSAYISYSDGTTSSRALYDQTINSAGLVAGTATLVPVAGKTITSLIVWFTVYPTVIGQTVSVVMEQPQLEYGTKATAWSPSYSDADQAIKANASAIQTINTNVSTLDGKVTSNSTAITNLTNKVSVIEQDVSKKADAAAVNSLTTRVEVAEGKITSQGTQITKLTNDLAITNGKVDAKADSSVVQALDSKVTQQGNDITSQGSAITKLTNDLEVTNQALNDKASVAALNALDTKVTNIDGTVTSQGTSITRIDAKLTTTTATAEDALKSVTVADTRKTNELPIWYWTNHPARIVNEFKEAAVIGVTGLGLHVNLETRVYYKDGSGGPIIQIAYAPLNPLLQQVRRSNGSGATATWLNWDQPLKNMDDAIKSKADASALSTLDAKVTKQGTDITAQGSAITKLTSDLEQTNAAVSKKADASALTTLDTKVTAIDGRVTSNTNAITTLSGRVSTVEEDVKKKADASVLTDYYTKVEADKAVAGSLEKYDANLVIGGSNLLRNTTFKLVAPSTIPAPWTVGIAGSVGAGASVSFAGNKATIKVVNAGSTSDVGIKQVLEDTTANAPFSISYDLTLVSGAAPTLRCNAQYYYTDGSIGSNPAVEAVLKEGRYIAEVKNKADVTKTLRYVNIWITTHPKSVGDSYVVEITKPQVERGHATAYAEPIADTKELIAANAIAIQNTNTEVSRINGVVVSHGSDITRLDNSLVTMQGQINSKADSSALNALDSKVTQQGKDITTQGTAITKVQASIDNVNNATNNLLMKSNVVGLYDGVKYPHHFYEMSGPWEIGGTYTLLWCAEHKRGTGDTNSSLVAYAGGGSQQIQTLTNTNGKVVSKATFVKNSAAPLERVNFYMINRPTADKGSIGTVYWAVLVKGSEVQGDSWFPGPYELKSEVTGLATAQSTLDAKVTTIDGKVTSNTSAITSLTGRVTATEGELAKKADASALNSYYTKVEADKATAGAVSKFGAALSVGSENLLTKARWVQPVFSTVNQADKNEFKMIQATAPYTPRAQFGPWPLSVIPEGTATVVSFKIKALDATPLSIGGHTAGIQASNSTVVTLDGVVVAGAYFGSGNAVVIPNDSKYHTVCVFMPSKSTVENDYFYLQPNRATNYDKPVNCSIKELMISVGTTYVEWQPPYEVVNDALKANADAITSTKADVSRIDGEVKAHTSQLTALTAKVDGKADASAVTSLQATVTQQGKDIAANTDATTKLSNRVTTAEGQIVSNTSALSTLTTKVTDIDGRVTSQANDITKLNVETASKLSFILATNRNSTPLAGNLTRGVYNSQKAKLATFARGLNLVIWNADGTYKSNTQYDTYGQTTTAAAALATAINNMPANTYFSIVGSDALGLAPATHAGLIEAISNNGGSAEYVAKWKNAAMPIFTSKKGQAPNTGIQHMFDSPVASDAIAYVLDIVGGVPVGLAGAPSIDTSQFASATALSSLEAKVTTIDGKTTSNANSLTQLQTTVDGHTSAIAVNASSINGIKAEYTIKLDVDGLVAGMGLINDGKTSAIGMNADYFYVGKPSNGKKPFMVLTTPQTIGGITYPAGTWIDVALIANATIGTAHIADASITNAKIKELDASKITTGVLNANRVRVGPTSTFDDGYNPSTKARTFVAQPTVPYSVGDIWKNGSTTYICKTQRVAGSFTASEWDKVGDVTSENTAANSNQLGGTPAATINTNISNADTKAGNAQTTANAANTTAGQAKTAAATADSKAVAADSKATAADGKATTAQNTANTANNQVNAWKFTGTTNIDGGNIQADTVTAAQIAVNELSAISATIGVLRTATTGARTEIADNLITVYDDQNRARVTIGVFD